MHINFTEHL